MERNKNNEAAPSAKLPPVVKVDEQQIDKEFERSLRESKFRELFSLGKVFYNYQDIEYDRPDNLFPVDMYILDYDTLIKDAEGRNTTFMQILKETVRMSV